MLALLVGAAVGAATANAGMGVLGCVLMGIAFGVWRVVRFLGAILEVQQAQVFEDDHDR